MFYTILQLDFNVYLLAFYNFCMIDVICMILPRAMKYSWVSLGYFAVNLSGGQPKMYWWFCCTGVKKSHEIAHICCQTQDQHMQWKVSPMIVHWFKVDPQWNYDITWNPRIHQNLITWKFRKTFFELWFTLLAETTPLMFMIINFYTFSLFGRLNDPWISV